ncbi:hypothetical protein [Haloferax larsenii]|uniref:Uncharacterized protein n=1 Tax=Haloferax larsenii TaxID=302484 RepID=A0A1H7QQT2_HALLR|nr:hypothetical protein [Haloferax larsenii]SEL50336.1 hypothetical protein SAMN04488691_105123 [Haloferax larsenii]
MKFGNTEITSYPGDIDEIDVSLFSGLLVSLFPALGGIQNIWSYNIEFLINLGSSINFSLWWIVALIFFFLIVGKNRTTPGDSGFTSKETAGIAVWIGLAVLYIVAPDFANFVNSNPTLQLAFWGSEGGIIPAIVAYFS